MITICPFQDSDAIQVGRLIADTFGDFNLDYAAPDERQRLLGPFRHAYSDDPVHEATIAQIIQAAIMLVAEDEGQIVGVLRGRTDRLQSLFVREDYHGQGIGRRLVAVFEQEVLGQGASAIRVASSLFATPFYQRLGYKKMTGVRSGPCFDGGWFPYQPMIKRVLATRREKG